MSSIIPLPPSPAPSRPPSPSLEFAPNDLPAQSETQIQTAPHSLSTNTNSDSLTPTAAPTARALVTLLSSTAFLPIAMSTPFPPPAEIETTTEILTGTKTGTGAGTPPSTPAPQRATPFHSPLPLPAFSSAALSTTPPSSRSFPRSPSPALSLFSECDASPGPVRAQIPRGPRVRSRTECIALFQGEEADVDVDVDVDVDADAEGDDSDGEPYGVLHSFDSSPRVRASARAHRSLNTDPHINADTDSNCNLNEEDGVEFVFNFERSGSASVEPGLLGIDGQERAPVFARAPSASRLSPPFPTEDDEARGEDEHAHSSNSENADLQAEKAKDRQRREEVITIDPRSKQVHFLASEYEEGRSVEISVSPSLALPCVLIPASTSNTASEFSSNAHTAAAPAPRPVPETAPSSTQGSEREPDHRTPNVYINGLPPSYPESALYTLTCAFGGVRSVRTFTRHVGGKASGYGFVLFDSVDSAEKCIEGLKNHRNLHPSFSKQVHKIPGTPYAPPGSCSPRASMRSAGSIYSAGESEGGADEDEGESSFKARMEKLRDPNSSNLYFEGLPLSIDEPTMAALVAPHPIRSSRFFQTKLSDPPRIIAFVRLETREAAEEIIERLHGRMVRGWNEPGCRISVRFADSTEQRELRRAEKKETEPSPNRLTIAQAALLNMRGQDLRQIPAANFQPHRPALHTGHCDDFKVKQRPVARCFATHPDALSSNAAHVSTPQSPVYGHARLPPHAQRPPSNYPPDMAAVLASMRAGQALNEGYRGSREHHAHMRDGCPPQPPSQISMSQARTSSGFTSAEEQILRAHERRLHPYQQYPPQPVRLLEMQGHQSALSFAGSRGVGSRAPDAYVQHHQGSRGFSPLVSADAMAENQFHAQSHKVPQSTSYQRLCHYKIDMPNDTRVNAPNDLHSRSAPSDFPYSHDHARQQQQHNETIAFHSHSQQQSQAHLRSTTLPPSHFSQRPTRSHQQNSSISFPSNNASIDHITNTRLHPPHINTGTQNFEHDHDSIHTNNHFPRHKDDHNVNSSQHHNAHFRNLQPNIHDPSETESPLVSPALTYGSARTPSTLSPSTPFFGSSFAHAQENYKGYYQEQFSGLEFGPEKQQARQ